MRDDRFPWVPYWPAKLLNAMAGMNADQMLVYQIVLLRIYEVCGPCRDGAESLARRCRINKRRALEALDALFKDKKLYREGDGIMNPFAANVLADRTAVRGERARAGAEGGRRAAEIRKTNQSRPPSQATAKPSDLELDLEVDKKERKIPDATASAPPDERTRLFRDGLKTLIGITGRPETACRNLIGKWLKDANDDALLVRRAIEDAERDRPAEPVSWIVGAINHRLGGRNDRQDRSASRAAGRLAEQVLNGELEIAPRPTRPSLLPDAGEVHVRLLPKG
jgi:hypothetical protein